MPESERATEGGRHHSGVGPTDFAAGSVQLSRCERASLREGPASAGCRLLPEPAPPPWGSAASGRSRPAAVQPDRWSRGRAVAHSAGSRSSCGRPRTSASSVCCTAARSSAAVWSANPPNGARPPDVVRTRLMSVSAVPEVAESDARLGAEQDQLLVLDERDRRVGAGIPDPPQVGRSAGSCRSCPRTERARWTSLVRNRRSGSPLGWSCAWVRATGGRSSHRSAGRSPADWRSLPARR